MFEVLAENSPNMIFINQGGRVVYVNKRCEEVMGYTKEEFCSEDFDFMNLISPESKAAVRKNFKEHMKGEDVQPYEYKVITKDGRELVAVLTAKLIDYEGHKAILGIVTNITQRRHAEEELRRYVKELKAVHDIDKNIIKSPDLASLLRFIVRKARALTGSDASYYGFVERDVIRYHTFSGIKTKEFKKIRIKKGTGLGWYVVEKKKPVIVEDFYADKRLKNPPYDAFKAEGLVSLLAVPFMSAIGDPMGVLYVAKRRRSKFTSEQKRTLLTLAAQTSIAVEHARLNEKTRKAYEELKSLDELKNNIIANVSHELRTPITIAEGALALAMEEEDVDQRNRLLQMIAGALWRQNRIIGDLLEAARLEKERSALRLAAVDLRELVNQVLGEFEPILISHKLKTQVKVEGLPNVNADYTQLRHVLRNLISNAIKFNREGGRIAVTAEEKKGMVEVCVSDTGIGIPMELQSKIFEPLYQIDSSLTRHYGGTGMGLTIVKRIIQAHGGMVTVESEPSKGSKFCLTLPAIN